MIKDFKSLYTREEVGDWTLS